MAILTVRPFARNAMGWHATTTTTHRVHIAQAILVNATAALRPRPLDFGLFVGEVRLLLSSLHLRRNQPLRIRSSVRGASSHVQRFVTEGAALAATTSLAEPYGWSLRRGLPIHVDLAFSWSGARPDLLYPVDNNQRIAGESRGRRVSAAAASLHQVQSDRLAELQAWEAGPHGSQWFMAWSWFTDAETVVDFFDPGRPRRAERAIADVASGLADELWTTAPSPERELLDRPVRGLLIDADMFTERDNGTVQAYIGVFRDDIPVASRGAFRPGQAEVEVAVSSRLVAVVSFGGGMDFADVAGTVGELG